MTVCQFSKHESDDAVVKELPGILAYDVEDSVHAESKVAPAATREIAIAQPQLWLRKSQRIKYPCALAIPIVLSAMKLAKGA